MSTQPVVNFLVRVVSSKKMDEFRDKLAKKI